MESMLDEKESSGVKKARSARAHESSLEEGTTGARESNAQEAKDKGGHPMQKNKRRFGAKLE